MLKTDTWQDPKISTPESGRTYLCKINRNGAVIESKKIYKNGFWFGGCRPFCENDIVISYKEIN